MRGGVNLHCQNKNSTSCVLPPGNFYTSSSHSHQVFTAPSLYIPPEWCCVWRGANCSLLKDRSYHCVGERHTQTGRSGLWTRWKGLDWVLILNFYVATVSSWRLSMSWHWEHGNGSVVYADHVLGTNMIMKTCKCTNSEMNKCVHAKNVRWSTLCVASQ